jgi:hypothetical protein
MMQAGKARGPSIKLHNGNGAVTGQRRYRTPVRFSSINGVCRSTQPQKCQVAVTLLITVIPVKVYPVFVNRQKGKVHENKT